MDLINSFLTQLRGAKYSPLKPLEEKCFFSMLAKEKDPAKREKLVGQIMERNLRLVLHLAKKEYHFDKSSDPNELLNEGVLYLHKAINAFDLERGVKFSTFATPRIKFGMKEFKRDNKKHVRLPPHVHGDLKKIRDVERSIDDGRIPTLAEFAKLTGLTERRVKTALLTRAKSIPFEVLTDEEQEELIHKNNLN